METIIALSIFTVISTYGMAALLKANVLHQKSEDMRSLIDSLSFSMDEITRNVRTGSNYRCVDDGNYSSSLDVAKSCSFGRGFAFEYSSASFVGDPASAADQWVYRFTLATDGLTYDLSKSVNGASTWTQINPDEVDFSSASGFSVLGAPDFGAGDEQQPLVLIKLVGSINYKNTVVSPFSIETVVSQRLIDSD